METTPKLAAALVKAQATLKPARKVKENPHLRSKYADLAAVWEACCDALTENGIAIVQAPVYRDGVFLLKTTLLHESGESMSGEYFVRPSKEDPQGYGSAVTYARRYSLAAMVGIVTEDDDGNRASQRGKAPTAALDKVKSTLTKGGDETISEREQKDLFNAWRQAGRSNEDVAAHLRDAYGISSTKEIKAKDYLSVLAWCKKSR